MTLTAEQALSVVNRLYATLTNRRNEIQRFEDYYEGVHPLRFASPEWRKDHALRFKDFSDNWCAVVADASVERLAVDGFRVDDEGDIISDDEQMLMRDWDLNEMPAKSSQGFLQSSIARRSAVIVWGNRDDEPVITWEHPSQLIVDYVPGDGTARYALKSWCDDEDEFATLYTADEVWKFQRKASRVNFVAGISDSGLILPSGVSWPGQGGWEKRQPTEDDTWPIKNPLGKLPVREFQNRPLLNRGPLSDIAGTVAMQDAINLLWAYLFAAADYASMPARVVLGLEPPKMPVFDATGQKIGERPVDMEALQKGRMLWLTGQGGDIKQWDAAKLDVFTNVINIAVKHVAAQTKTPIHYIVGELGNVNGDTLAATETPAASKARKTHTFYTPEVRGTFELMALVRGNTKLAEACRVGTVQWRNPETVSDAQVADAASKDKAVGFPLMWIAEKRYGYTQAELAKLQQMLEAERTDPVLQQALKDTLTPQAPADQSGTAGAPLG